MLGLLNTYPQIKLSSFGELVNFFEHNKEFSFALLQPSTTELYTGINKNNITHGFVLFVGDQLQKGGSNALEIFSSNMEIIDLFLFDLKTFSTDLILNMDNIQIEQDFYSQDEECAISIVRFSLTTTTSTNPPC